MMTIAIISHPNCLKHEMGFSHPEQPARITAIANALEQSNLKPFLKNYLAPLATKEQLKKAHDPQYIEAIFQIKPNHNLIELDPDTLMNEFSLEAALRASGAVIMAVDLVMQEKLDAAFCNVRPPGHHAEYYRAMGFCFFNNIAVGAAYALDQYQLQRIAIIDFDVHHGNGTEDIVKDNKQILLCSSFQYPFYPFTDIRTPPSNILHLPLSAGSTGKEFRTKVKEMWLPTLAQFQPELIFISAGFDAHINDPLANLAFTEEDYYWISSEIKYIADQFCKGRIVSALEGGYDLTALGKCVVAHLRGLLDSQKDLKNDANQKNIV